MNNKVHNGKGKTLDCKVNNQVQKWAHDVRHELWKSWHQTETQVESLRFKISSVENRCIPRALKKEIIAPVKNDLANALRGKARIEANLVVFYAVKNMRF
jgi:hypothetical protein